MSALSSAGAQIITVGIGFVLVPITLGYLGPERYGFWITISSVLAIMGFADLGLGNGLLNAIGEASGKDDKKLAATYVSTGFFMLCGISLAVGFVGIAAMLSLSPNWKSLFSLSSELATSESSITIGIMFVGFILAVPLSIAQRVRMGYQQGYVNSLFVCLGSVLGLLGVVAAVYLDGGLPWIAGAVIATPLVAQLANTFLLVKDAQWLIPTIELFETDKAIGLLRLGLLFFLLQLSVAIAFTSDNLVIASILGSEAVTSYAVPLKFFSLVPVALGFIITPLWPAYREAVIRGDTDWVRLTLRRSIMLGIAVSIPAATGLVLFGKVLIKGWSGGEVNPSLNLILGFGIFVILNGAIAPLAMFYNGLNVVTYQVFSAIAMATLNIILSIILVREIGVAGAIYGTVIAQVLCTLLPAIVFVPRLLRRLGEYPESYSVSEK